MNIPIPFKVALTAAILHLVFLGLWHGLELKYHIDSGIARLVALLALMSAIAAIYSALWGIWS